MMVNLMVKTSLILVLLLTAIGCEQKGATPQSEQKGATPQSEQELTALKIEVSKLNNQIDIIQKQVNDIHEIATQSQKPKVKKLADLQDFDADGSLPVLGESDAQIAIIEFSDFQCPYCKRYLDQTFPLISKNYIEQGKVRYLIRDYPLSFHPKAEGAAIAGYCALQQNNYWPFREQLFNNMSKLDAKYYLEVSQKLQLNETQFTQCLQDEAVLARVKSDIALGKSLGVTGTPSFIIGKIENNVLINPQLITGAQSFRAFSTIIDELIPATNIKAKAP